MRPFVTAAFRAMPPRPAPSFRPAATTLAVALLLACATARAEGGAGDLSTAASELSLLPIAVVAAVPASVLVAGATFTVAAVETSAEGVEWVLVRASDGLRFTVRVAGRAAAGSVEAVGTVVAVTMIATGSVLEAGGRVIAFVPNELGRALLHHQRVSR